MTNVLIAGVGGQGVLLAGEILASVAAAAGKDVKMSEVHGMAQRGGSVVSHLRFGPEVRSPLIPRGETDFLVSFEKLEALRAIDYCRRGTVAIVNDQEIPPLAVGTGRARYPREIEETIVKAGIDLHLVPAAEIAARAGTAKAVNSVILGALSCFLPFRKTSWERALKRRLPARLLEVNLRAFSNGVKS